MMELTKEYWAGMYEISNKRACALEAVVRRYKAMYPAFRSKPVGGEGSPVRNQQTEQIALEDDAMKALRGE
jgi:hypothetical protein